MIQFIYDQSTRQNRYRWHFFNLIRMRIAKRFDPAVQYTLSGRKITLPFSHPLPIILKNHPLYSRNLTRLAGFLRAQLGSLMMIDVGANIGDSYCLSDPHSGDSYLLIEGESKFFEFLSNNTHSDPSVDREFALLTDDVSKREDRLMIQGGNATLQSEAICTSAISAGYSTLDRLLESHPKFQKTTLLKVDVEGYDRRVLMGGRKLLAETKPVIFFEHHPRKIAALGEDDVRVFTEINRIWLRRIYHL